jgi:acetyl esterase
MLLLSGLRRSVRRRTRKALIGGSLEALARAGRLHPLANPRHHKVEILRDIPYTDTGRRAHLLDVYRPTDPGPHPVVLYIHGGGFTQLSKDTHWIMGLAFARRGFMVVNASYRLAPRHPFPAAIEDSCAAYAWTARHAEALGGDLDRLVLAGESAGANLVCALTVAACFERPEPFAREVFELGVTPRATLPACGMLQVSEPERFWSRRHMPGFVKLVLRDVNNSYLGAADPGAPGGFDLADPLLVLEGDVAAARPLPAFFAGCGTRDPLLDDTRRLGAAIEARGGDCEIQIYPDEIHAFHALVWRSAARRFWGDTYRFLAKRELATRRHVNAAQRL